MYILLSKIISDFHRMVYGTSRAVTEYIESGQDYKNVAKNKLDEWNSFLKTGDIKDSFTAKGLAEARERLRVDSQPDDERREFFRELERQMVEND